MKKSFQLTLKGKELFPLFIIYWVVNIAYQAGTRFLTKRQELSLIDPGLFAVIVLSSALLFTIFACAFQILFARLFAPKILMGDTAFGFKGSIPRYIGMVLLGVFLSIITAGIYIPWFAARIGRYLAGETSIGQKPFRFNGKGGALFLTMLAVMALPIAAGVTGIVYAFKRFGNLKMHYSASEVSAFCLNHIPFMIGCAAAFILVLVILCFLVYKWYINGIALEGQGQGKWKTKFFPSVGFILLQVLFTIVTAGIAFPAAMLFLTRYFVNKIETEKDGKTAGRFSFETRIGKGFLLIWGQLLLCIITVGIYGPWAICKVGNYLLTSTYFESVK